GEGLRGSERKLRASAMWPAGRRGGVPCDHHPQPARGGVRRRSPTNEALPFAQAAAPSNVRTPTQRWRLPAARYQNDLLGRFTERFDGHLQHSVTACGIYKTLYAAS